MTKYVFIFVIFLALPGVAAAQELHEDIQGVWRAEVVDITNERTVTVPGTDVQNDVQTVTAGLLEGERSGETITFENDYIQLEAGQKFYLNYLVTIAGDEYYSVREVDRRASMAFLVGLFIVVILVFGGIQGLRSLLSLAGSLLVVIYALVPALVQGMSPIPVSVAVAAAVLFCAIFFTHGFNRRSAIAYAGTMIAVALTGLLAIFAIDAAGLTGFTSDETTYLNIGTGGALNFSGLLLAGIIIGALGVLDDIAVTQVAVVRELLGTGARLTKWDVYRRALRVGKEHVGALVNTLVLAYTGAALPLLLLFSLSESGALSIINREIFATEIVRALVGSIGLILTVPITTLLAVWLLYNRTDTSDTEASSEHAHTHSL